jgi:hypothetical protein
MGPGIPRGANKPAGSVLRVASALRVRRIPPVARDRCQAVIAAAVSEEATAMISEISTPPFDGDHCDHDERSPSQHLLDELALHGYRPFEDEPDPRPLPSSDAASLALESVVKALSGLFSDTRLEADLPDLLWSFVNLFHRKANRIGRDLDDNETAQRRSHTEQDGSQVRSVELERLIAQGLALIERRNGFEFFRGYLADLYANETGSSWRPRSGSQVNHRALTSAMIGRSSRILGSLRTSRIKLARWAFRCGNSGGVARERLLGISNFEELRKIVS